MSKSKLKGHWDEDPHPEVPPGCPNFARGMELNKRAKYPGETGSFADDKWYFIHRYPYPDWLATQAERDAHDAIFMLEGCEGDDRQEAAVVARCAWMDRREGSGHERAGYMMTATAWREWGNGEYRE